MIALGLDFMVVRSAVTFLRAYSIFNVTGYPSLVFAFLNLKWW
jgi:hypothetical protein